jgi:cell division septation protein DedD
LDVLIKYVEEQLSRGYKPELIKERMIRQGYSPALVDGVVESVMMRQGTSGSPGLSGTQQPLGASQEKSAFPKIILVILFLALVVVGVIFIPKLLQAKEPLLDVQVSAEKLSYAPGEEVGFDLEITNMGSAERFDITLISRLLDKNDNTLLSKEETIAISTSASYHKTIQLPSTIKPGSYVLKVFANYADKVATSSFSFEVTQKASSTASCNDGVRNQDETNIDCGGTCTNAKGVYWYDNACHFTSKTGTQPIGTCTDGVRNQDETNIDCGGVCASVNGAYWYDYACHMSPKPSTPITPTQPSAQEIIIQASAAAENNPEEAKSICMQLETTSDKDACFEKIAEISKQKEYCELITEPNTRDLCYKPFFFEYKDFTVCEKLTDLESRKACEQLREIQKIIDEMNSGNNETAAQMTLNNTELNYFND